MGISVLSMKRKPSRKKRFSGPEGKIKTRLADALDKIGAYYFMPATGGYGKSGVADFCISYNGLHIQIETKATTKLHPTELQRQNGTAVWKSGGIALLVRSEDQVKAAIKYITNYPTKCPPDIVLGDKVDGG